MLHHLTNATRRITVHTSLSCRSLSTTTIACEAAPVAAARVERAAITSPRSIVNSAAAAGLPLRLTRLADNVQKNRKASFENGKWMKAKVRTGWTGLGVCGRRRGGCKNARRRHTTREAKTPPTLRHPIIIINLLCVRVRVCACVS